MQVRCKSSGEGGWKRVAMLQPVKCSGSSKLGGSGAKASDTQHMAYLTSGAHNARFRLFVRTVSAKKKSIRAQSRDWRLQGDQNPPYLGETSPAPGRRSRPHGRMRTIPGAMDISGIWTARSRSWLRPWVACRHLRYLRAISALMRVEIAISSRRVPRSHLRP